MTYPLVQELAAEGIPVRLTCGVLGFSLQAFCKWQANPVTGRERTDAHLTSALVAWMGRIRLSGSRGFQQGGDHGRGVPALERAVAPATLFHQAPVVRGLDLHP